MIHNKLLVPFARFISVKFAVWCDDMIYDILIGNREDEIKRLKEEKKFARLSEDGYTSIIGLVQRTDYSKEQIQNFFKSIDVIEMSNRIVPYWRMKNDMNGLVQSRGKNQTPYLHYDRAKDLLNQYYKNN